MARCKRIRRSEVSPEEWIAHRKSRKKIASAKWYAHKKKREIREEHTLRQQLEEQLRAATSEYLWTPTMRAYHRAVVDHVYRGYPVRPPEVPALQWSAWADTVEEHLRWSKDVCNGLWSHIPWEDFDFQKCLRQLGMREAREKASRVDTAASMSSAASCKRWAHSRNHTTSFCPTLWSCSVPGVVLAGLVRQGRAADGPRVMRQMIHVFHPSNTTDHQSPCPVQQRRPPTQKPNPKLIQPMDHDRESLRQWIQRTAFPAPLHPVSLDHSESSCSSLDSDFIHDAFGRSPGDVADDSRSNPDEPGEFHELHSDPSTGA